MASGFMPILKHVGGTVKLGYSNQEFVAGRKHTVFLHVSKTSLI